VAAGERDLMLGLKAKARLRELLDGGTVTFKPTGHDYYRRTLAHVYVDGQDVGAKLVAEGHALRWSPGPQAKAARWRCAAITRDDECAPRRLSASAAMPADSAPTGAAVTKP
jgi:endonuclease YncB( thermonuclease family)